MATKGGLENPVAIYVDGRLLRFIPEIELIPLEPGELPTDPVSYFRMRQRALGERPFPEKFQGSDFEVWALTRYPNPEELRWWQWEHDDWKSPLFNPDADTDEVRRYIKGVYQRFTGYYPPLAEQRPAVFGWYTWENGERGERFRLAIRPYVKEVGRDGRTGRYVSPSHHLTIATTLPREQFAAALQRSSQ
ncbi:MAG: hypothetical protein HYT72_05325 [Candidatus Aenigmarchaeota archaeon]|nr:hypothetical protein [Candidatus Aenigmarchaeota archaeon]